MESTEKRELYRRLNELEIYAGQTKNTCEVRSRQIEGLIRTVEGSNGNPGLKGRIFVLEQIIPEIRNDMRAIKRWQMGLFGAVSTAIIIGIVKTALF